MTEEVTPTLPPAGEESHDSDVARFEDEGGPVVSETAESAAPESPEQPHAEVPAVQDPSVESFENEGGFTPAESDPGAESAQPPEQPGQQQ